MGKGFPNSGNPMGLPFLGPIW